MLPWNAANGSNSRSRNSSISSSMFQRRQQQRWRWHQLRLFRPNRFVIVSPGTPSLATRCSYVFLRLPGERCDRCDAIGRVSIWTVEAPVILLPAAEAANSASGSSVKRSLETLNLRSEIGNRRRSLAQKKCNGAQRGGAILTTNGPNGTSAAQRSSFK